MILLRQDRPGLITIDFAHEPTFDRNSHGNELTLGLFTVEGGPNEIIADESGQLGHVLTFITNFLTRNDFDISLDPSLKRALSLFHQESSLVEAAQSGTFQNMSLLRPEDFGIHRPLLLHQREAVRLALNIRHMANFSVPGSGKTTSSLSIYAILRQQDIIDRLLVIGPASSFEPWENEFTETFGRPASAVRLIGTSQERLNLLRNLSGVELVLCTYQMAYRERENITTALQAARYLLILDESHHVKNINLGPWARTAMDLAPYAERRMILTGTPAPRSLEDLWSQFTFLWPSQGVLGNRTQFERTLASGTNAPDELRRILKPFFIRTKKSDLHLPNPISLLTKIPYRDIPQRQRVIIRLLEQRTIHEARTLALEQADVSILRRWRRARTLRLLQAASNPALLANTIADLGEFGAPADSDPTLATVLRHHMMHETPIKIAFVENKVRELVAQGNKVLVWATFVDNLLLLERVLQDLNPLKIYRAVPAYNEENDPDFENRERNIMEFKTRDDRPVLLANPAACSESVSLHMVCHHAVYLERTFNCGQFLQSMDRIHRVGMPHNIHPHYHIPVLQCAVEQLVDLRLARRQQVLYRLLDDDMPVFGIDDDSFLADREDDLEEIFQELLQQVSSNAEKGITRTSRRNRPRR